MRKTNGKAKPKHRQNTCRQRRKAKKNLGSRSGREVAGNPHTNLGKSPPQNPINANIGQTSLPTHDKYMN